MRDGSKIVVLLKQTVKMVHILFFDIAGSDKCHEDLKELCKEMCKEKCDSLQIFRLSARFGPMRIFC